MAEDTDLIAHTVEIVSSYVGQNNIRPDDLPSFIAATHAAIRGLESGLGQAARSEEAAQEAYTPAVTVRKSLANPDHIVSMIDGKPYKTLKRHLSTNGLTPADYRHRYGLRADYPMVAPTYSEMRKGLAQKIGLGRKPKAAAQEAPKAATKKSVGTRGGSKTKRARTEAPEQQQAEQSAEG